MSVVHGDQEDLQCSCQSDLSKVFRISLVSLRAKIIWYSRILVHPFYCAFLIIGAHNAIGTVTCKPTSIPFSLTIFLRWPYCYIFSLRIFCNFPPKKSCNFLYLKCSRLFFSCFCCAVSQQKCRTTEIWKHCRTKLKQNKSTTILVSRTCHKKHP